MVLGLTLLTEPNLSLATTKQVDDLKKKSSKKKIDPWPLWRGQGSTLTALTLLFFLATNKLNFNKNKFYSKKYVLFS